MSNSLNPILDKIITRSNLSLRPKLNFIAQANRDYKAEVAQKGDVINIPRDEESQASDVTPAGNRSDALPSDSFGNDQMRITQWKEVTFSLNDKERRNIDENAHYLPTVVHSKVRALAEAAESRVASKYTEVYHFAGAAGTTPYTTNQAGLVAANKILNDNHNEHGDRAFIMGTAVEEKALMLNMFSDVSQAGDGDVKTDGTMGQKFGYNHVVSTFIPTHTLGATTGSSVLAAGAQTAANANSVDSDTGVRTTTLAVDGLTGQPVAGDKFTIAGDTQQYVVKSSTTLSGDASTLTIEPALQEDVADDAELTFVGSHVANVVMHRRALTFAQRDLEHDSATNAAISQMTDPVSGLSLRIEAQRAHKADVYSMDMLYDAKYVNPESAVILLG